MVTHEPGLIIPSLKLAALTTPALEMVGFSLAAAALASVIDAV
jgi:hypothetical protein